MSDSIPEQMIQKAIRSLERGDRNDVRLQLESLLPWAKRQGDAAGGAGTRFMDLLADEFEERGNSGKPTSMTVEQVFDFFKASEADKVNIMRGLRRPKLRRLVFDEQAQTVRLKRSAQKQAV